MASRDSWGRYHYRTTDVITPVSDAYWAISQLLPLPHEAVVDLQHFAFLSRYASIWSSSSRDGPGGITASWAPATAMTRSTTPARQVVHGAVGASRVCVGATKRQPDAL
jgi:hypothetical protein